MRRGFPIIIPVLIGVGLLALLLGYNRVGRGPLRPDQNGITRQSRNIVQRNMQGVTPKTGINRVGQQMQQQVGQTGFDQQRAENLKNQLSNIDGVGQVSTVVKGDTALVGCNTTNAARDANATKNMITEKVKQVDSSIKNVVVSDSGDVLTRIRRLADNIKNSRPANELTNDYNQIMQTVTPGATQ